MAASREELKAERAEAAVAAVKQAKKAAKAEAEAALGEGASLPAKGGRADANRVQAAWTELQKHLEPGPTKATSGTGAIGAAAAGGEAAASAGASGPTDGKAVFTGASPALPSVKNGLKELKTVAEAQALVRDAAAEGRKVRVVGAAHTFPRSSVWCGPVDQPVTTLCVLAGELADVQRTTEFADRRHRHVFPAGAHLGRYPPTDQSDAALERSVAFYLDSRDRALPDTGGITHQTVGGFLSTGSAGGSLQYDLHERIVGIELVDGQGKVWRYLKKGPATAAHGKEAEESGEGPAGHTAEEQKWLDGADNHLTDEQFLALGVSCGLFGLVTAVVIDSVPTYYVGGKQGTYIDGTSGDPTKVLQNVVSWHEGHEYTRTLWFPQPRVGRVQVWQAAREKVNPLPDKIKRYQEFTGLDNFIIGGMYRSFLFDDGPPYSKASGWLMQQALRAAITPTGHLLNHRVEEFCDKWYRTLPMDWSANDEKMTTTFLEAWIPMADGQKALDALKAHYDNADDTLAACGDYSVEIYAAKQSKFYLSPAHGTNVLRIDAFWFTRNEEDTDPEEAKRRTLLFKQVFDVLREFKPRYHLGKHLDPERLPGSYLPETLGAEKWALITSTRATLDPKNVFLTDYHKQAFGFQTAETQ